MRSMHGVRVRVRCYWYPVEMILNPRRAKDHGIAIA
jgi:hypothetical protein